MNRTLGERAIDASDVGLLGSSESEALPVRPAALAERRLELVVESVENLAHDLGNALMSLTNYAELAMHSDADPAGRTRYTEKLNDTAYAAIDLVRQLRSVASTGGGEPRAVPVGELVVPAIAASRSGLRHRRVDLDEATPFADDRVRARPDDAIHAIVDLLDVARSCCLGATRLITVGTLVRDDAVLVRASIANAFSEVDDARLALLGAFAERAGAELVVRAEGALVLELVFHRAE